MRPSSKLYVKVAVKKRPYSQEPVSISVTSSFNPHFTYPKALYYATLNVENTSQEQVESVVKKQQILANAEDVVVLYSPGVFKFLV